MISLQMKLTWLGISCKPRFASTSTPVFSAVSIYRALVTTVMMWRRVMMLIRRRRRRRKMVKKTWDETMTDAPLPIFDSENFL